MIISVTYIVYLKLSVLWLHILFSPVMRVDRALRGFQRVTGHRARSTRFHKKCVCSSWTNNELNPGDFFWYRADGVRFQRIFWLEKSKNK